jgi:RimJ/RimL family protein N-acetyltransferase
MLQEGKQVSNLFSAHVPESWPPTAVEPPTNDAIGWKRFYLSHPEPDGKKSIVGIAGIGVWPAEKRTVQVGAALVPEYQGQRLGEEIVAALGKWALSQPQYDSVVCDVPENHLASAKSLGRAGYVKSAQNPMPGYFRFVMTR